MPDNAVRLLGADHLRYGELTLVCQGPVVAAISIGADESSPSLRFKGDVPNEDAVSVRDDGRFARLVVADAHFGLDASEMLVRALHQAPYDVAHPPLVISGPQRDDSRTSFTTVWLDREHGQVRVASFGDALALRLRHDTAAEVLVECDTNFVTVHAFEWREASHTTFVVEPGDVLVAFTDGVNECHYRRPATSITLHHIQALFEAAQDLETFVRNLGESALVGVDGNPGGQDNIAIAGLTV